MDENTLTVAIEQPLAEDELPPFALPLSAYEDQLENPLLRDFFLALHFAVVYDLKLGESIQEFCTILEDMDIVYDVLHIVIPRMLLDVRADFLALLRLDSGTCTDQHLQRAGTTLLRLCPLAVSDSLLGGLFDSAFHAGSIFFILDSIYRMWVTWFRMNEFGQDGKQTFSRLPGARMAIAVTVTGGCYSCDVHCSARYIGELPLWQACSPGATATPVFQDVIDSLLLLRKDITSHFLTSAPSDDLYSRYTLELSVERGILDPATLTLSGAIAKSTVTTTDWEDAPCLKGLQLRSNILSPEEMVIKVAAMRARMY